MQIFADHTQSRTFLTGLLIVPGVQLEAAFNENRTPFFQILAGNLGLPCPKRHVDKSRLFFFFAIFPGIYPVDGETDLRNCSALGRVPYLRVTSQIAD